MSAYMNSNLPNDVKTSLLMYLPQADVLNLKATSREWSARVEESAQTELNRIGRWSAQSPQGGALQRVMSAVEERTATPSSPNLKMGGGGLTSASSDLLVTPAMERPLVSPAFSPDSSTGERRLDFVRLARIRRSIGESPQTPTIPFPCDEESDIVEMARLSQQVRDESLCKMWAQILRQLPSLEHPLETAEEISLWMQEHADQLRTIEYLKLKDSALAMIPSEIKFLSGLQRLSLSGNNIAWLPEEIRFLTSLKKLDISNNKLTQIPEEIRALQSLQVLNIAHNRIHQLSSALVDLPALTEVSISSNPIVRFDEGWQQSLKPAIRLAIQDFEAIRDGRSVERVIAGRVLSSNGNDLCIDGSPLSPVVRPRRLLPGYN